MELNRVFHPFTSDGVCNLPGTWIGGKNRIEMTGEGKGRLPVAGAAIPGPLSARRGRCDEAKKFVRVKRPG
jgi:hypothetical protein